ncbi:MAG: PD-(D/E)XK nuclease family protein [Candidatus Competibacteraceae bacterium]
MAEQLSLLESETVVTPPTRSVPRSQLSEWSYSRRSLFEQCPRRYYYNYYGSSARTACAEPLKEQLRFLKSISNISLRAGEIMHLTIRTYLNDCRKGKIWKIDSILSWAQKNFLSDLRYSREYKYQGQKLNEYEVLLLEFYHNQDDAEANWEKAATRLQTALTNFFTNPEIEKFRLSALYPDALIEKRFSLKGEHFRFTGQIDLAYREDSCIKVVDWKIGESGGSDDSLQLLFYALVILDEFKCTSDSVELFKVCLEDGEVLNYMVTDEETRRARMRIIQDGIRMRSLDHYGREGIVDAFTPCQQSRICRLCPFQSLCPQE